MTIKELRAKTGLSQAKFAAAYGLSKRTLQNWEQDRRTPPDYILNLLQRAVEDDFEKTEEVKTDGESNIRKGKD